MTLEQTTLQQVSENVEYYHQLQEEKKRIEMSLEIAKKTIMDALKYVDAREYTTPTGIKAWIETRARKTISYKEAESLLPKELLDKLTKETISVILTVRQLKEASNEFQG